MQYVPENKKTDKICKLAVQNYGDALQYVPIEKLSEEIIKLAVRKNCEHQLLQYGYVLIKKITNEIIKLVPEERITYVRNIIENEIINFALNKNLWSDNINIIKLAILNNSKHLELQKEKITSVTDIDASLQQAQQVYQARMTEKIIKSAVQNNKKHLIYCNARHTIDKTTNKIIKSALKNNGYIIIYVRLSIEKMSDEISKLALENNINILQYIRLPKDKITIDIIKKDGYDILEYILIEKMLSDLITLESVDTHNNIPILIHI